ncbi:MAG TPA: flagellar hook-length control protein FliK [Baekduia sp.]|nr:flagellar hook-length control protein FliK [Baekduia sp.]
MAAPPAAAPAAAPAQPAPVPGFLAPVLTPASMHATISRLEELARIASLRGGQARAVLQLKPAELGAVDIQLRTSPHGLVATIHAHDQAGLQALAGAGGDLRRALEDRGVTVQQLDIQLSPSAGGDAGGAGAFSAGGFDADGGAWTSAGRSGASAGRGAAPVLEDDAEDELVVVATPRTSAGSLVDVQA